MSSTARTPSFFELDGPYKAMILRSSKEEDKLLKKLYAVFNCGSCYPLATHPSSNGTIFQPPPQARAEWWKHVLYLP